MNDTFMKEKPVFPLLTSMALPMVASMLVSALYNIVDSLYVARISEEAMTALSLVYPVQNFINAVAIGFSIGISALISLHLGAGNQEKADTAATHGMVLSLLHGIIASVAGIAVIPRFLRSFTTDETVIALGLTYARIAFLFSVIIMAAMAFEKIFQGIPRGQQESFADILIQKIIKGEKIDRNLIYIVNQELNIDIEEKIQNGKNLME